MFGLEYVQQAQDWLKENYTRAIMFDHNGSNFNIVLMEGTKTIASANGNSLADTVKNVSENFKKS